MEDLLYKIKNECVLAYHKGDANFGNQTLLKREESSNLFTFCGRLNHHVSNINPFVPKRVRTLTKQPNHDYSKGHPLLRYNFYLVHYAVNERELRRAVREHESKENLIHSIAGTPIRFSADIFLSNFQNQFGKAGVIWPYYNGSIDIPKIVGNIDTTQEIIDVLKKSPEIAPDVIREICFLEDRVDASDDLMIQWTNVLDCVKRPKKTSHVYFYGG